MTARPLTIGIDARAAAEVPAGRGRYVRELLVALERLPEAADVRFELYAREPWGDLDPARFAWQFIGLPDPAWHLAAAARASRRVDAFLSTNSYLTAWFLLKPTAVVVYDLVPFVEGGEAQSRAATIEKATIRPALRRAKALACISAATQDDLVRLFPVATGKATTIPLAADEAFAQPVAPPGHPELDKPYVLAVGTLEPRKNLERLVEAWRSLPTELTGRYALALVGPRGWDDGGILQAAHEAGAHLLGRVSDDELRGLYAGASAFVYPSLYEGFGLPVLEAMAAGAPVVTSNRSSLPEVAGDAALMVDPLSVPELAQAIGSVLTDDALAQQLRAAGRLRAAEFSWERTARETLALLRHIALSKVFPMSAVPATSWSTYYQGGATLEAFFASLHHHEPLIREVLSTSPSSVLEAGSGPAIMSSFFAMAGLEAIAVDNDPGVLQVARESASGWKSKPEFVEHDIFKLDTLGRTVDTVFSQGVLEHFGDEEIRELTRQSLAIAPRFVFSVPSKWYGHQDFGNERLFLADRWAELLAGLGTVTVRPYFFARRRYTYALKKPLMVLAVVER